jgi:ParB-like chromosome segregation protein Spo0J
MARTKGKAEVERKATALEKLEVTYVKVSDLKPNDYNPNRQDPHDFKLLLSSMETDGFTQPIVALRDGTIVDGEHRWRAGSQLGYEEIPVVFVDMTPEQARVATLRHNRARGSEDLQLTAEVLRDLERLGALDWAQDQLMMDDVELQRLIEDIPAPDALAADEFSDAWEPTKVHERSDEGSVESRDERTGGITTRTAMTTAAIEAQRERERELAKAKTAEDREEGHAGAEPTVPAQPGVPRRGGRACPLDPQGPGG